MKAKEKAAELYMKFFEKLDCQYRGDNAKRCALACVSEIKSALISYGEDSGELQNMDSELRWWDEVENELKKL